MKLPADWSAERASGWFVLHHLVHEPCGWRYGLALDLVCDEADVRRVVFGHECEEVES